MRLTRRDFGIGAATTLVGTRLVAQTSVGAGTLITVSDGHLVLPISFALGALPEDKHDEATRIAGLDGDTYSPPCNLALYLDDTRTVLFDAGSGPSFMPSAGALIESLDAAGVAPCDVTDVVFTHAHPDHIWGVLDDFDEKLFPDAAHHIGQSEADYWMDPNTVETIGEARAAFAVGAKSRLEAIADGLSTFSDGDTVVPGITARASFGHTPGHMSFVINDAALVVGDAIGNGHLALARPEWPSGADQDTEQGIATRTALLADLADSGMTMVGFHLPSGGMGRIEPDGDAYRFVPEGE